LKTNRRNFLRCSGAGALGLMLPPFGRSAPADNVPAGLAIPKPVPALGMNLNGPADWNTELPFVDVFRLSRRWISQRQGAAWGQGPELALDAHGWVTRLEPECSAEAMLCTINGGHYPAGDYTVIYEGEGKLETGGAASVAKPEPGRMILHVNPQRGGFSIKLVATNPQNPLRNLRVIMPGFEDIWRAEPFHPVFLKRWAGLSCLRFMDWMKTNDSQQRVWSDRPTPEDATFTTKGVALEWMIDLCNRLQSAPWFCLPHLADDDYIREFALLVKRRLDPSLKIYVEYSNEVWNGQFEQSRWAGAQGIKLGFAEKPWEGAWRFTAVRSVQMFKLWEEVFGGTTRLVRVLPSQAASPHVSGQVLEFQEAWKHADALAIAPYVTCNVGKSGEKNREAIVEKWTVDDALDYLENTALPESVKWIEDSQRVAGKYGLKLLAYEGGQHMVGIGGVENNDVITRLLQAANDAPRLAEVYRKYFAAWSQAGGDLFCYFASVSSWSKWGSWGILQYYDSPEAQSPKFTATMRWAKSLGQRVNIGDESKPARR
jgi:hypothetical protein